MTGAMTDDFHLPRFNPIQLVVDAHELVAVGGEEIGAVGVLRHGAESFRVELFLAHRGRVTDRHRMNPDAALGGHAAGLNRGHPAGRVVAVGQGDNGFGRSVALIEERDTQPDGIAEGGARPGHADGGLLKEPPRQVQINGKRGLQKRRIPENHQPHAVALAADEEVAEHLLDRAEAVQLCAGGIGEVLLGHGA